MHGTRSAGFALALPSLRSSSPSKSSLFFTARAIDPVCGMTVDAGPASYPLEHEGSTYYFCMAGCRRSFEQDPAAYLKESRC